MDIIASHQHGLFEILEAEAQGLAGRPRDSAQRAVVYHHLADMLAMSHAYALLAAKGALGIEPAVEAMRRAVRRSWWRLSGAERAAQAERVERFAGTLRALDAAAVRGGVACLSVGGDSGACRGGAAAARARDGCGLWRVPARRVARSGARSGGRCSWRMQHWAEALVGAELDAAIVALDWRCGARRAAAGGWLGADNAGGL